MVSRSQTYEHDGAMRLSVTGRGARAITVETDPNATGAYVYADGQDSKMLENVSVEQNGASLDIHVDGPITIIGEGSFVSIGNITGGTLMSGRAGTPIDLRIVLPPHSDIDVQQDGAAFMNSRGEFGVINSNLSSADISISGYFKSATPNTQSGNITAAAVFPGSRLEADTGNGQVTVREFFGQGSLTTSNGTIRVDAATPDGPLHAATSHGNVTVNVVNDQTAMGLVTLSTLFGNRNKRFVPGAYTPSHLGIPEPSSRLVATDLTSGFRASRAEPKRAVSESAPANGPAPSVAQTEPSAAADLSGWRPPAASQVAAPATPQRRPAGPEVEDIIRLDRGKRHARLAATERDWSSYSQVMVDAFGLATAVQGQQPEEQVAAFRRFRDEVTLRYSREADALQLLPVVGVAIAVGWAEGSNSYELFAQLRHHPEMAVGMPPDMQAVASAGAKVSALPADVRDAVINNRVRVRAMSPDRWAVDVLPIVDPVSTITTVQRRGAGNFISETIAETLRNLPTNGNIAVNYYVDDAAADSTISPARRQALGAVAAVAEEIYPPIRENGELARPANWRKLAVAVSTNTNQRSADATLRFAQNVQSNPTSVTLFTPDGLGEQHASYAERVFGPGVGHITGRTPSREDMAAWTRGAESIAPSVAIPPPISNASAAPAAQPAGTAAPAPTPHSFPRPAPSTPRSAATTPRTSPPPPPQSPPVPIDPADAEDLARIERGKVQARLAEANVPASSQMYIAQGRVLARQSTQLSPKAATEKLGKLIDGLERPRGIDNKTLSERTVAAVIGWAQEASSQQLLAQLREEPALSLMGLPPDMQHIGLMKLFGAVLPPEQLESLSHNRALMRLASDTALAAEILPTVQPTLHVHQVLDAQSTQEPSSAEYRAGAKERLAARPSLYGTGLVYLGKGFATALGSLGPEGELVNAMCAAAQRAYPAITASGSLMDQAPERRLIVNQRVGEDAEPLIAAARNVMPEPTSVQLYTPDGENFQLAGTWQSVFSVPVKYQPNAVPSTASYEAMVEEHFSGLNARTNQTQPPAWAAGIGPGAPAAGSSSGPLRDSIAKYVADNGRPRTSPR